jgi:hypothetical protein
MKKIFVLAVLPALFLFGCKVSGTDSILAPAIKVEAPQKQFLSYNYQRALNHGPYINPDHLKLHLRTEES